MRNVSVNMRVDKLHARLASLFAWAAGWMLLSSVAHAQARNMYIYSEIAPDRMFSAGPGRIVVKPEDVVLRPRGNHLSLINHVLTPTQPGAFITVSSSEEAMRRLAATMLRNRSGATGYIYTVRADSSFYDVQLSFRRFLDQQRAMDMDHRYPGLERAVEVSLRLFEDRHMFVTTQPITSGMITSSMAYRLGQRGAVEMVPGGLQNNWRAYSYGANSGPSANLNPYDVSWPQDTSLLGHLWVVEGEPGGWVQGALATQCLAAQGPSSSSRRRREAEEASCPTPAPLIDLLERLKMVSIMLSSSAGGSSTGAGHDEL